MDGGTIFAQIEAAYLLLEMHLDRGAEQPGDPMRRLRCVGALLESAMRFFAETSDSAEAGRVCEQIQDAVRLVQWHFNPGPQRDKRGPVSDGWHWINGHWCTDSIARTRKAVAVLAECLRVLRSSGCARDLQDTSKIPVLRKRSSH